MNSGCVPRDAFQKGASGCFPRDCVHHEKRSSVMSLLVMCSSVVPWDAFVVMRILVMSVQVWCPRDVYPVMYPRDECLGMRSSVCVCGIRT